MKALPEFKEAGFFFLAARWLPPGTTRDQLATLTVDDLRLEGKPVTRIGHMKLARAMVAFYRAIGVTIKSPYALLGEPRLALDSFLEAVHGTQS